MLTNTDLKFCLQNLYFSHRIFWIGFEKLLSISSFRHQATEMSVNLDLLEQKLWNSVKKVLWALFDSSELLSQMLAIHNFLNFVFSPITWLTNVSSGNVSRAQATCFSFSSGSSVHVENTNMPPGFNNSTAYKATIRKFLYS